jgi:hypothetical protein
MIHDTCWSSRTNILVEDGADLITSEAHRVRILSPLENSLHA